MEEVSKGDSTSVQMDQSQSTALSYCFTLAARARASSKGDTCSSALVLYGLSTSEAAELQAALGGVSDHAEVLQLLEQRQLLKEPMEVHDRARLLHTSYTVLAKLSGRSSANVQDVLQVVRSSSPRIPADVVKDLTATWSSLEELDFHQFLSGLCAGQGLAIEDLHALLHSAQKLTIDREARQLTFWPQSFSLWCCSECPLPLEESVEIISDPVLSPMGRLPPEAGFTFSTGRTTSDGPPSSQEPVERIADSVLSPTRRLVPEAAHTLPISRTTQEDSVSDPDAGELFLDAPRQPQAQPPVKESLSEEDAPSPRQESMSKVFVSCWTLVRPDRGEMLSFEEAMAFLVLLGVPPAQALFLVAKLTRLDPLGPVPVASILSLFVRLGLRDDEEHATARARELSQAYQSLNPSGAALSARDFAQLIAVVDANVSVDFYSSCAQKELPEVSVSDFVVLMLQPEFYGFIVGGGLQRMGGDRAELHDRRPLTYVQRLALSFVPSYDRFRAACPSSEGEESKHWRKTDLLFDAHCLEAVGKVKALKAKLMIYLVTFLCGALSVIFAVASVWSAAFAADELGSDASISYYAVSNAYDLVLTAVEIALMTLLTTAGAGLLARATGVTFSPYHKQRRKVLSSLLRSALDLGFSAGRRLGVDPFKRASVLRAVLLAVVVKLQRSVIGFLFKLILKKTLPRLLAKKGSLIGDGPYEDYIITSGISLIFGIHGSWVTMHNAAFCCLGAPSAVHTVCQLFDRRDAAVAEAEGAVQPLSDAAKLAALRAVAVTMSRELALFIHPNAVYLLQFLQDLWVSEEFLTRTIPLRPKAAAVPESSAAVSEDKVKEGCLARVRKLMTRDMKEPSPAAVSESSASVSESSTTSCLAKVRKLMSRDMKEPSPLRDGHKGLAPYKLDEEELFFECLSDLRIEDFGLVVALLSLACIVDGSLDKHDWPLVVTALEGRKAEFPSPSLVALGRARRHLWAWFYVSPETLYAVFDGTGKGCLVPWQPEFPAVLWLKLFPRGAAPLRFGKD